MQRVVLRRTIPGALIDSHTIDLRLVALAAAIETLQVDLVARGWVDLFGALLEPGSSTSDLRWAADGPGGEAEIKRAYSALFGRFFGRAILTCEHNCRNLRQVYDGMTVARGFQLRRRSGSSRGDLPDWVGWNGQSNAFTICEAKGSRDAGDWRTRLPKVLVDARSQIDRVEIIDATGRIQTKDWVVASRWGTVANAKEPTIVTVDPLQDGRHLSDAELESIPSETYARWIADLLRGLGRVNMASIVSAAHRAAVSEGSLDSDLVSVGNRTGYAAIVIDGAGVFSLRGARRREHFEVLRETATQAARKPALLMIERAAALAAARRVPITADMSKVALDNDSVSLDGVTLTWNLDNLQAVG